jgi:hypothetical protein
MDKYFYLGRLPTGRAEFIVIRENGTIEMLNWTIADVYQKLISKSIQAVNLSKDGIPPPQGFPRKRW